MKIRIVLLLTSLVLLAAEQSAAQTTTLRAYAPANSLQIGAAVSAPPLRNDPMYGPTLAREFSMLTPEDALKFGPTHPARDRYNFTDADFIINFAQVNQMLVRGHTLVWDFGLPSWLTQGNFSRDELINILRDHIYTVVGRYRGRIAAWDVVNEAFFASGAMRTNFWYQRIGPDYIEMAFRWAHEADPAALLFYNDYDNEVVNAKSTAIYNFVRDLLQRGVPINGVGLQTHLRLDRPLNMTSLGENMQRIANLGLQVQITEMDVRIYEGTGTQEERFQAQAQVYRDVMNVCLNTTNCTALVTWGFTDRYSWVPANTGHPDSPLLFDTAYQPKPAYHALIEVLAGSLPVPDPTGPAIRIDVTPGAQGGQTQVTFRLFNVTDVYGIQAECSVDPTALTGVSYNEGDGFNGRNSFMVNSGFNASNGSWTVAASRLQPNPAISGNMVAFGLTYNVLRAGNNPVNCTVLAVDADGHAIPLEVVNGVSAPVVQTAAAVQQPVPQALPAIVGTVSGVAVYQNGPDNAGITVQLRAAETVLAETVTPANGSYQFANVAAGSYTLLVSAPQHLPVIRTVSISDTGAVVEPTSTLLPGGDTDNNGVVDILDATFIGANFGIETPPAPANADLNRDAAINVSDLVLVGFNFGLTGPVVMQ